MGAFSPMIKICEEAPEKGAAHPKLGIVTHYLLRNCPICSDFVHHISLDAGTDAPWFCEAHRSLTESFQHEPQRTIEALQKHVTELELELAQLKCASTVKTIGIKHKTDPSDHMDVDRAHPAKRVITEASEASVVVPHIGFDLVDAEARPNPAIDLTLIEYSDFLPGNPLHEVKFTWNPDNSSIIPPDHIHNLLKSNRLPHIRSISGPTAGAQMFLATNAELESLISEAHTSGGWSSLTRLRLSGGLASLLEFLWTQSPDTVSVLAGTARKILSADINPAWARHSTFSGPSQFILSDDSFENPKFKLTCCTKVDVKTIGKLYARLPAMGVTTTLMDSLYPWALQYCIDACSRPNLIKAPIRRYYAEVFINAQHCLMFYPLPIPSDATYVTPAHWKLDHITKYRRRCAVVQHWKETNNPKYSKDKEISANRHNPFPEDDATTNGVADMVLDGALTQPSDGDQPIPGPSEA
ncbi:hypothetical protein L218DRAFT_947965 [Marasmius fiardii PR-910]|nr:hypothetical protein L218DRAFT_947965 [Marasmius fiardii PR-910]